MDKNLGTRKMIYLILVLGLILRLISVNQSLWLDEAIGALAVRDFSYQELFTKFFINDNHPPLYYLILKMWTDIFGYSEMSLRLPSVLFGLGTIYLTFRIAQKLTDSKNKYFPIISAILISTSQFHIYYSQEARMYSQAAFFASLVVFLFLSIIKKEKDYTFWIIFSFSIAALVFTDYMPVFILPVFWIYGIISRLGKGWWIKFIASHIPLIILSIFWLPSLIIQSEGGRWLLSVLPAWKNVAGGANLKQAVLVWTKFTLGRISLVDKKLYYLLIVISSILFIPAFIKAYLVKNRVKMIWLWFLVPLVFGFMASYLFPAFIYFRYLYVLPAFYLIVAWGISNFKKPLIKAVLFTLVVLINLGSWLIYISDPHQQKEAWRDAVNFVESNAKATDVAIFEYPEPFTPYRWYSKNMIKAKGVTDSIAANPVKTELITEDTIKDKMGVFYFEYLKDLSDPKGAVEETLLKKGFKIKYINGSFPGIGQIKYWTRE